MEQWGIWTSASIAVRGVRFETVEYAFDHWSERHAHEIAFVDLLLCGAQEARWNGSEVRRTPGTLSLMPTGEAHATTSVTPTRTFQIAINPDWSGPSDKKKPLGGPCKHLGVGPITWHLTHMWAEFRRRDDLTPAVLEGKLQAFLDALNDEAARPGEVGTNWLRRARDFVREHAKAGFAVADVAEEVGVDPAHLMRTYVARYGVTLGDDARNHRVAHACRMLAAPGTRVGDAALAAGFADQSHLNRIFKRHTGLTPREYRTTCLGG
jgi:AraC-like DNA-binding protein